MIKKFHIFEGNVFNKEKERDTSNDLTKEEVQFLANDILEVFKENGLDCKKTLFKPSYDKIISRFSFNITLIEPMGSKQKEKISYDDFIEKVDNALYQLREKYSSPFRGEPISSDQSYDWTIKITAYKLKKEMIVANRDFGIFEED